MLLLKPTTFNQYVNSNIIKIQIQTKSTPIVLKTHEHGATIKSLAVNEVAIWPNPATNLLYLGNTDQITTYQIFQFDGKQVSSGNSFPINISEFTKGIYLIKIQTKTNRQTTKFIKQ